VEKNRRAGSVRKFEIELTYDDLDKELLFSKSQLIKRRKTLSVELDDSKCHSPEDFCNNVIDQKERHHIIKLYVKEKFVSGENPLYWIRYLSERIYFHRGIPLTFTNN
jgi:hypothetical protein